MEAIILAFTPVVVVAITQFIKYLKTVKYSENKKTILRVVAAILSFIGVVLGSLATGNEISPMFIEEFVKTLAVFAGTQLPYMYAKNSLSARGI